MKHTTTTATTASWKKGLHSKSLMIAIAAVALTATNAQAYSGEVLEKAGLTGEQREAFKEARDLGLAGDKERARDVLVEAGIDTSVIERVRTAMSSVAKSGERTNQTVRYTARSTERDLTPSEQAAFAVAKAANDRDAMDAILEEAGLLNGKTYQQRFLRDGRELQ